MMLSYHPVDSHGCAQLASSPSLLHKHCLGRDQMIDLATVGYHGVGVGNGGLAMAQLGGKALHLQCQNKAFAKYKTSLWEGQQQQALTGLIPESGTKPEKRRVIVSLENGERRGWRERVSRNRGESLLPTAGKGAIRCAAVGGGSIRLSPTHL